jgi:hypothetical protein
MIGRYTTNNNDKANTDNGRLNVGTKLRLIGG